MRSALHRLLSPVRIARNKIFFLIFCNGFLLALLVYFYTEDNYEEKLFEVLAQQVTSSVKSNHPDSILLHSLRLTYNLEQSRLAIFQGKQVDALKSQIIRPVTYDLMTGNGACGSYAFVLSRMLNELGVETRFAQMKVGNEYGGHIIVEAKSNDKWVALDASYDLMFRKPQGGFASFNDVKENWNYYKAQTPANYDQSYNYSAVRYTNWNKIPVIMPALKGILNITIGEKAANEFSLRSIFLKKFDILFKFTLVFYILFTLLLIRLFKRQAAEIENFRVSLMFPKRTVPRQAAHVA
jgi:hypothetical protein